MGNHSSTCNPSSCPTCLDNVAFDAAKIDAPDEVRYVAVGVKGGRYIRRPVGVDLEEARRALGMFADVNRSVTWRLLRVTRSLTEEWVE